MLSVDFLSDFQKVDAGVDDLIIIMFWGCSRTRFCLP